MVRRRPDLPAGHGELVADPPTAEWSGLLLRNAGMVAGWDFEVAGRPIGQLRAEARRTLTAESVAWSERLGIETASSPDSPELIVATGHQPDLYHTGVWAKDFLLQQVAERTGATPIDIVVDSDTFTHVGVNAPCFTPGVARCRQYLAFGGPDVCFACAPAPQLADIELFCEATAPALESLPAPSVARHFATFCQALRDSVPASENLAELLTAARRTYEGVLTNYLELPVTVLARSEAFARFAAEICLDARRFVGIHNEELDAYRELQRIRSAAQPFPDLDLAKDSAEAPFWLLGEEGRRAVRVRESDSGVELYSPDGVVLRLGHEPDEATRTLLDSDVILVPRALTLTLFVRTFLADLFIHGIGGSRYDRVTDAVARRWWGIELPRFVTASLTMYLPLGVHAVTEDDISAIDHRLHRLAHNPDGELAEIEFDGEEERREAFSLAAEKQSLVEAISAEGADRKALGMRIRAINEELAAFLEPLAEELRQTRARLSVQLEAGGVINDRTYPYCLWSPQEVADKVW